MKRQTVTLSTGNKLQELMSSIESKLDLLANEDLDYSMPQPLARSQPTPQIPSSPNKPDLHMSDLAHCHSPVLSKIEHIEQQYLHQLSALQAKVCRLETQNDELRSTCQEMEQKLGQQRQRRKALEQEASSQLDRNLEEMKASLISRVREEMQQEAESYLQELADMRTELSNERKTRRQLQKQVELVAMERDGFEQLYRQIMDKYKQLMQADIQSATHDYKENQRAQMEWKERSKDKQKEGRQKRRKSKKRKAADLPREELIPFLTKGIEELKQKLKL